MPLCFAFSALLLSSPAVSAANRQSLVQLFQTPMTVVEPVRLALTPKLDGVIEPEEWDPLVSGPNLNGYFQWEPGKLHFAGVTPNGNDLLISIDFGSNGWLVGEDNVEVRVSNATGTPTFTVRQMDGTAVSGPRWRNLPGIAMASRAAATSDAMNTTYEFTLDDAGLGLCPTLPRSRVSLRLDAIPSSAPPTDPFLPRLMSPLQLDYVRSAALPNGVKLRVENAGVFVPPGEGTRLRFAFNGNNKMNLVRLNLRGEGAARNLTELGVPFPVFDDKGRAFVDYPLQIPAGDHLGFRIVRGTLISGDGLSAVMEASFRVAPLVDISFVRKLIRAKPQAQTVRFAYYIKSNAERRLAGDTGVSVQSPLTLARTDSDRFIIDGPRSFVRVEFEVQIPGGTQGVCPVSIRVNVDGKEIRETGYVNIL